MVLRMDHSCLKSNLLLVKLTLSLHLERKQRSNHHLLDRPFLLNKQISLIKQRRSVRLDNLLRISVELRPPIQLTFRLISQRLNRR